jgi:hypothetical protein
MSAEEASGAAALDLDQLSGSIKAAQEQGRYTVLVHVTADAAGSAYTGAGLLPAASGASGLTAAQGGGDWTQQYIATGQQYSGTDDGQQYDSSSTNDLHLEFTTAEQRQKQQQAEGSMTAALGEQDIDAGLVAGGRELLLVNAVYCLLRGLLFWNGGCVDAYPPSPPQPPPPG